MRICHISTVHAAGDVRIYLKECISLSRRGHEVHLISKHNFEGSDQGVHHHSLNFEPKSRIQRIIEAPKRAYEKAVEIDADVYHFHDPELLFIGRKLAKTKRVIYDVHEDVPKQILGKHWIPSIIRNTVAFAFGLVERFCVKGIQNVVAATPFIEKRFKSYGLNTVTVNNYPYLSELSASIGGQRKGFCYVGGISRSRGALEMVRSLQENQVLTLAGPFAEPDLRAELEAEPNWSKVNYLGIVNRQKVAEILTNAEGGLVTLLPLINYIDSRPIKMFEYMSASLPVIASDFPLWKEIIEFNKCGICVNPKKPIEIFDAMKYLEEHPKEAKEMGLKGRKAVEEKYNWEVESEKLFSFYDELMS